MPAPQGEMLTVVIDGDERTITIEPTLLSRRSVEALSRVHRKIVRESVWQELKELSAVPDEELPSDTKEEIRAEYKGLLQKSTAPTYQDAITTIQSPEGMIVALEMNSDLTREDAMKVVEHSGNIVKLLQIITKVVTGEDEASKN